jgi:hypothetical protein
VDNPGAQVEQAIEQCFEIAQTWLAWDVPRTPNWTLREISDHLTGVVWYAEQVGRLPR